MASVSTDAAATSAELADLERYRRCANYIAAAAIYLQSNELLEEPLKPEHIKPRLLGHWGTVPGINLVYAGLNRLIKATDASVMLVTGPGHGAPANHANLWLEGSMEEVHPNLTRDRAGLAQLIKGFSWPGGFPSHLAPMVPGVIHEGGELGYALATAFGAVLDNPDLICACIVGDGEAECGPTAGAWHSPKFLDPAESGAVLPILHLNGYKIANPCVYASMSNEELTSLFEGFGYKPLIVEGDDLDAALASALDESYAEIRAVQDAARNGTRREKPIWPMICLRSPKGWTGIDELDGLKITGTHRSHQVPAMNARRDSAHLAALEGWLRSYKPEELFDDGKPLPEIVAQCPTGDKRMGASPHCNGGKLRKPLDLPSIDDHALDVAEHGGATGSALEATGAYFAELIQKDAERKSFRIVCPDEVASNRMGKVFDVTTHAYEWPVPPEAPSYATDGRVMEVLSEHNCQGWMQGYVLTGRHCVFPCYEAFISIIEGMVNQYSKFLKMSRDEAPWREPVSSLNYILTSIGWRQDHNGYSHQAPGFINSLLNKKDYIARIYLPPDANTMLATMETCMASTNKVNVVIASKHPLPQWLPMDEAKAFVERGAGAWDWASSDGGEQPDVVLAACGTIPTIEIMAAAKFLREHMPEMKVRVVNVTNLLSIADPDAHEEGMSAADFEATFTKDRPVIFSFHGYPSAIHQLLHHRPNQERFHVRGYNEEGTTTTPFDLLAMNGVSRYNLVIDALHRADVQLGEELGSASAAFATRSFTQTRDAIEVCEKRIKELQAYAREHGEDNPEITGWSWTD